MVGIVAAAAVEAGLAVTVVTTDTGPVVDTEAAAAEEEDQEEAVVTSAGARSSSHGLLPELLLFTFLKRNVAIFEPLLSLALDLPNQRRPLFRRVRLQSCLNSLTNKSFHLQIRLAFQIGVALNII